MDFSDFDALSFDCYGTLIDWEAGIAAVLQGWAGVHGLALTDEELLAAYAADEAEAERDHPTEVYPQILARSMRSLGETLGVPSLTPRRKLSRSRSPTGQPSLTRARRCSGSRDATS